MVSDLAGGDSMRFSWSGSPTVNPFKLDAIICTTNNVVKPKPLNSKILELKTTKKHSSLVNSPHKRHKNTEEREP